MYLYCIDMEINCRELEGVNIVQLLINFRSKIRLNKTGFGYTGSQCLFTNYEHAIFITFSHQFYLNCCSPNSISLIFTAQILYGFFSRYFRRVLGFEESNSPYKLYYDLCIYIFYTVLSTVQTKRFP